MSEYDAAIVGAGPNGLAAAITLASKGLKVVLFEAGSTIGGGTRTAELTEPGFQHDVCSAIHPMAVASPFFQRLALEQHGVEWIQPTYPLAHPLDGGRAAILQRSLRLTADGLEKDRDAYIDLMGRIVQKWDRIDEELLSPLAIPRDPVELARFGLKAFLPAAWLLRSRFATEEGRALLAGICCHATLPLTRSPSMAVGLVLGGAAHTGGWPIARGGSQTVAHALSSIFTGLGGEIVCDHPISNLGQLPPTRLTLLDTTPRQFLRLAGDRLGGLYAARLRRFRYGPGVFKLDYALDGPVPWANPEVGKAGTVHLGGNLDELCRSEQAAWAGHHSERPYVLVAQQSLFDSTRAPAGKQTLWAYCHVPNGSVHDMTPAIESQIERFAPGFRDIVRARSSYNSAQMQNYNPNYIGGDIAGGSMTLDQLFTRPVARCDPYSTPLRGVYLCSSSTPPGAGVHGMCGHHAALSAWRQHFA
jgi:phytoene dehydrogenase-like protein